MADVVAYVRVPWITGYYGTQTRMAQMDDNAEYNRQRTDHMILYSGSNRVQGYGLAPVSLEIQVDNVTRASITGAGTITETNVDITGVAKGIRDIKIIIDDGEETTVFTHRFYKHADINLVSIWATFAAESIVGLESGDETYRFIMANSVTVMGHREAI